MSIGRRAFIKSVGGIIGAVWLPVRKIDFDSPLAEMALWNRVLTNEELSLLGQGFSPLMFPEGLQRYAPLVAAYYPASTMAHDYPSWRFVAHTYSDSTETMWVNGFDKGS